MAWGGPDGQLAQIREQSKDSDKLALTDEVDGLIEGLKISLGWLSDRDKEIATDNPDILGDDLYRLARGGLRNTLGAVNFLSDVAIKSSEGKLNDPIGAASIVGHGLRLADFATKKSGEIGGAIAEHGFGVDPRVGQAIGSFAPDLLLSRGAGTLSKLKGLRIGIPTRRALAIAGGYGGVPAATMMNIPDLSKPLRMVAGTSATTKTVSGVENLVKTKAGTYKPKTNSLARYNEMILQGYDFKNNKTINNLVAKMKSSNVSNLPKNITQYTDEALYRAKVKIHLDGGGTTADIRDKVGVFVDKDGSVKQIQSRGDLQLRRVDEDSNTKLNRALTEFQQSPNLPKYDAAANVRLMMKKIGFEGTQKEFTALYHIHHVNSIKVYKPFFFGLDAEGAARLRKLAADNGIFLGNHPNNLTPLIKRKHTLDPDSIHTWQRRFGIEGSSKDWEGIIGSYDPQANLEAMFKNASVEGRLEALLLYREYVQTPVNEYLDKLLPTAK